MNKTLLNIKSFLIILVLSLSLCACTDADSATSDADSATSDADNEVTDNEIIPFEPLTDIVEGRPNIYLIIKVMDSNYWQSIVQGAAAAGRDLGCNVYYSGTTIETDWEGQRELLKLAVSKGADAVILGPDDSVKLAVDIESIYQKGIPVFLIDTIVNTEQYDVCYMTDNLLAGHESAAEMISQLYTAGYTDEDNLQVAIIAGTATSQTISERISGFYQYWSDHAPANWAIIPEISICNADTELAYRLTNKIIDKYPKLAGMFGTNNTPTKGMCLAIKEQQKTNIAVVGYDYSDEIKALVEDENYHASAMIQKQYDMSYLSVKSALDKINGQSLNVKYVDTGIIRVNHESLSSPEIQEVLSH